ncbi:MAG: virulence RhuM family protein, partial [Candidatus Pacebacteria bacterium]|nr:virulence RhuM family protein [Candidatus Paceibacterota bacterium]
MTKKITIKDELTEFLLYTTNNSDVKVEIFMHNETVWLPQKRMAELFGVDVTTINEHLKNIYKSHELEEDTTIGKFPIVQTEGKREVKREVNVYNLDAILSVGYRVNSSQATQFRIWATKILKEYIIKG